ncbi:hypothetical protein [Microcoleus sp. FACHB-672]|uniref:hypothetical protein n=1 Tax=Microcoleus sp. FACHB-672 TaxID=2692825 RepID=UPI001687A822|nr:hypothetical protein [Microcoleus sp. FACHB-672]MBD2039348.1 hypothetical protein [Microcoleus sp. FACHB-672]
MTSGNREWARGKFETVVGNLFHPILISQLHHFAPSKLRLWWNPTPSPISHFPIPISQFSIPNS